MRGRTTNLRATMTWPTVIPPGREPSASSGPDHRPDASSTETGQLVAVPGSPATRSRSPTATRSAWPCAAGASRSSWCTASPPRASSTRRRFRLVRMGFKVIAIDTAGHGGTQGLPTGGGDARVLQPAAGPGGRRARHPAGRVRRPLDGRPAGHRAGGRRSPTGPSRVILLDAIVGDTLGQAWSTSSASHRPCCWASAPRSSLDTLTTVPFFGNPRQAVKLGRLVAPTLRRPRPPTRGGCSGPASRSCGRGAAGGCSSSWPTSAIPVVVIHGDRDLAVPVRTARAPPAGPGASWWSSTGQPLVAAQGPRDPAGDRRELLEGRSARRAGRGARGGRARPGRDARTRSRRRSSSPTPWSSSLTPPPELRTGRRQHHQARYRWTVGRASSGAAGLSGPAAGRRLVARLRGSDEPAGTACPTL